MTTKRGSSTLLVTVLVTSVFLLAWSILSMWHHSGTKLGNHATAKNSSTSEALPPPLDSKGAKASLFYPVLKARGPQPGSNLVSKPLIPVNREQR